MAAAMHNKFRMLFQLRTSSIRPSVRDFHRLTNPKSMAVSLEQFRDRKQRNSSGINFNKNDFLFTSGRMSSFNSVLSVRFNSSSGGIVDVPYIPTPPKIPSDSEIIGSTVPETVNAVNALGEPTLQSLGLGAWTPVGMVQQLLEYIHITLDIPWWGAICILSVCLRTLMFPIFIKSRINAGRFRSIMPEMKKYQAKLREAKRSNHRIAIASAQKELDDFLKRSNLPRVMFLYPMIQLPVFITVFLGLNNMAMAPVESMKNGGMLWFTDLTLADPTYTLPLIYSAFFLTSVEVGAYGVNVPRKLLWFMRCLPIVIIPIMIKVPTLVLFYWVTSNTISLSLMLFLKIPGVKPFFNIPEKILHAKEEKSTTPKKTLFKEIKKTWDRVEVRETNKKKEAIDSNLFKRAASGPVPKTYTVDPTGGKSTKSKSSSNTGKMPKNNSD